MKVFVSYSRKDAEFVARLGGELNELGYDVWVDTEDMLTGGQARWRRSIVAAIRASDVIVLVLSPNSTISENVERELSVATENAKRVIPVMYQDCELPDGFQYDLAGVQRIDFNRTDFKEAVRQLVAYLGPPHVAATPPAETADPLPPVVVAATTERWRQPRVLAIAGATVAALLIGTIVVVAASGGDESSASTDSSTVPASVVTVPTESSSRTTDEPTTVATVETIPSPTPQPASTAPTVATQPLPTEEEQAKAIVLEWRDATTVRDWETVKKIDQSRPEDYDYDSHYGRLDEPDHMVSIEAYFVSAQSAGSIWTLTGAVLAYDMIPEPTLTTNFVCSVWTVDIPNHTAAWNLGARGAKRIYREVAPSEFEAKYAELCT